MNVLELFCGTKSVGKCCEELAWNSISIDNETQFNPTHLVNIMDFDYKQYPKDHFDIIWASPPCTYYSKLQHCWIGRKKQGEIFTYEKLEELRNDSDKLMKKTFEIIDYFNPHWWFVENPYSCLKDREIMKDRKYHVCDYCMYCDWGYKKRTCIWTNKDDWKPLICDKSGSCGNMVDSQHKKVLGNGYEIIEGKKVVCNTKEKRDHFRHKKVADGGGKRDNTLGKGTDKLERYRIPPDLIYSLFID